MSSSHERRVITYLKPKNDLFVKNFAQKNEISLSEAVNICVKDYFQRLPTDQKNEYLLRNKPKNNFQ